MLCFNEKNTNIFLHLNMVILGPKVAEEIFRKRDVTIVLNVIWEFFLPVVIWKPTKMTMLLCIYQLGNRIPSKITYYFKIENINENES